MEQKKRNGHARHGKRLLGLLMALAMLGVLFMPVYATNDAESTAPAETAATVTYEEEQTDIENIELEQEETTEEEETLPEVEEATGTEVTPEVEVATEEKLNDINSSESDDDKADSLDSLVNGEESEIAAFAPSAGRTFNITNTIENAEVAYVKYEGASVDATASKIQFNGVTSNVQVKETLYNTGSNTESVLIFFVKPANGYLLTQYEPAGSTSRSLYGITVSASKTDIGAFANNTTNIDRILAKAKDLGYVGYYAFSYRSGGGSASFTVKGQRPQMKVDAVADPNTGLKPGDKVTFTITITPGKLENAAADVTGVRITSLVINGKTYTVTDITKNEDDGTYSCSVEYDVTEEDWNKQEATLDVKAQLDYEYVVGVSDMSGKPTSDIATKTTIEGEASTSCTFEMKKGVTYEVKIAPEDADKTDGVTFPAAPEDNGQYFEGNPVTVKDYTPQTIEDATHGGTWNFDGWYRSGADNKKFAAGEQLRMGKTGILFVGTWKFTPYPDATLTIAKQVTGDLGDKTKQFEFSYSYVKDGKTVTVPFTLVDGQTHITEKIPVNTVVTITEKDYTDKDYTTTHQKHGEAAFENGSVCEFKITVDSDKNYVLFVNDKRATPDTGVLLDSMPYVIILIVVAAGIVGGVMLKKRKHGEDDV